MANKPYQNEAWLREKYLDERKTITEMGDVCGVSGTTITTWMDKYGIDRRGRSEAQIEEKKKVHDEEWLREQYVENKRSMADIADEMDMSASGVKKWIDKFDIESRTATEHRLTQPASYFTGKGGYEHVSSKTDYEVDRAQVHQLVAVAKGANPHKVFSNGRYHVHHKNRIYWDNRPENLVLKSRQAHGTDHNADNSRKLPDDYPTDKHTTDLLLDLRGLICDWRELDDSKAEMFADELDGMLRTE